MKKNIKELEDLIEKMRHCKTLSAFAICRLELLSIVRKIKLEVKNKKKTRRIK